MPIKNFLLLLSWASLLPIAFAQQSSSFSEKDSLRQLGDFFQKESDRTIAISLDSCLWYTQKARDHYFAAEQWGLYVDMISGMAGVEYYRENFESALTFNQQALEEAQQYLGDTSASYANALLTRAIFQDRMGATQTAIATIQKALVLVEKSNVPSDRTITTLYNLANLFIKTGDYHAALRHLDQALDYRLKNLNLARGVSLWRIRLAMAECFYAQDKIPLALQQALRADSLLKIQASFASKYKRQIDIYYKLGKIYRELNEEAKAKSYAEQALQLIPANKFYQRSQCNQLLGKIALASKDFSAAEEYFNLALTSDLQEFQVYQKHPQIAESMRLLAQYHQTQNQVEQALEQFQAAIIKGSIDFNSPTLAENPTKDDWLSPLIGLKLLRGKAQVLQERYRQKKDREDLTAALECYQAINQLIPSIRQSYREEGSKQYLAASAAAIYEEALECYWLAYKNNRDERTLRQAFLLAEQNKARLLQDAIRSKTAKGIAGIPDTLLSQERQLRSDLSFYRRAIAEERSQKAGGDADKISLWKRQVFEKQQAHQKIVQQLEKDYPRYTEYKYQSTASGWKMLREKLRHEDGALLEYFVGERQIFAFVLSAEQVHWHRIAEPAKVREAVFQLRGIVETAPDSRSFMTEMQRFHTLAYQLYQDLIAPLDGYFPSHTRGLRIVPDEWLNRLPFDLLLSQMPHDQDDYAFGHNEYLLRRYTISYAYSADWWTQKANPSPQPSIPFLGLAPSFNGAVATDRSCTGGDLFNLACSEAEVTGIQSLFEGDVLLGDQATRTQFERTVKDYQIVHLATHACQSEAEGELNKIFFADDFLSNLELNQLDLQAELAVLSACNTGSGRMARGEGVMSLARGFAIAGCPSVLMTVWAVDDCSTQQLLQHFYYFLKNGKRKDDALRRAKVAFLLESDLEHSHPYFWAGFVFFGEGQPLHQGPVHPWYPWIGFGLLGLIVGLLWYKKVAASR